MTRPAAIFGACPRLLLSVLLATGATASAAWAPSAAWAQGIAKESIPGGVEARPSDVGQVPKGAPAPPPPMGGSPSRSGPALESVQPAPVTKPAPAPAAKDPKDNKDTKGKKSSDKAPPAPLTRSIAPGGMAPAAGTPSAPANDESKPGAVERVPSPPKQPPQ